MLHTPEKRKKLLKTAFFCYILLMLWLLFGQRIGEEISGSYFENLCSSISLSPFQTIRYFAKSMVYSVDGASLRRAVVNLGGNVIMFIPLGFFIPCVFEKQRTFWRSIACSAVCIAAVELLQLFTLLGSCDVDDFILNIIGALIGRGIFAVFEKQLTE